MSQILFKIQQLSFKEKQFKILSAKWPPFCAYLSVVNETCSNFPGILQWPKTGNKRKADNADSVDSSSGGKQIKVKKEPTLAVVEADFKPHDYKPQLQSQSGKPRTHFAKGLWAHNLNLEKINWLFLLKNDNPIRS